VFFLCHPYLQEALLNCWETLALLLGRTTKIHWEMECSLVSISMPLSLAPYAAEVHNESVTPNSVLGCISTSIFLCQNGHSVRVIHVASTQLETQVGSFFVRHNTGWQWNHVHRKWTMYRNVGSTCHFQALFAVVLVSTNNAAIEEKFWVGMWEL